MQESMPLVSIIIPSYNRAWCLAESIDSALDQTYGNYEVLIVDDGSTDGTVRIVESYGDRVTLIQKPNGGVSSARNAGIRASRGEFLIFLDSDDLMSPDLLMCHIKTSILHPDADVYGADCAFRNSDGSVRIQTSEWPLSPGKALETVFLKPPPPPACQMYRRRAVDRVGLFDEGLKCSEDSDFFIRTVATGGLIVRTVGGHALYRPSPDSITAVMSHLKQHKTSVLLNSKHRRLFAGTDPGLIPLIAGRLDFWRNILWTTVLQYHWSMNPIKCMKLAWYLFGAARVDPGFIGYLARRKPWRP